MAHDEFPELTHQAKCVLMNTMKGIDVSKPCWDRRFAAAVLREAMTQTGFWKISEEFSKAVDARELEAIADNLHALPPPPPTWDEMRNALAALVVRTGPELDEYTTTIQRGIAHHCKEQP
jgi:hypothetical protein